MMKKIFLSYSGAKSKRISEAFGFFLSKVLPQAEVIEVGTDIAFGEDWRRSVMPRINGAFVAILFLTEENINKPWVSFEAGQLVGRADLLVPYLSGVKPSEVHGPFATMECVVAEREDTKRLIRLLAQGEVGESSATDGAVDVYWPVFENHTKTIPSDLQISKNIVSVLGEGNVVIGSSKINVVSTADVRTRVDLSSEQAFERIGAAIRQGLSELQKNFDQARTESRQFFRLTVIFASLGFVVLLAGVGLMFAGQPVAGAVASAASIIPEATAALFFRKDRELRDTIGSYHTHMIASQKLLTMIDVCETIANSGERDLMKKQIILRALDIA